jgi:chitin synthase
VGNFLHFFTSPFMNIVFLVYSLFHSDFERGKTREVVQSEGEESEDSAHGRQMLH